MTDVSCPLCRTVQGACDCRQRAVCSSSFRRCTGYAAIAELSENGQRVKVRYTEVRETVIYVIRGKDGCEVRTALNKAELKRALKNRGCHARLFDV